MDGKLRTVEGWNTSFNGRRRRKVKETWRERRNNGGRKIAKKKKWMTLRKEGKK